MDVRIEGDAPTRAITERKKSSADVWLLIVCYAGLYIAIGMLLNDYVLTPEVADRAWMGAGPEAQIEDFAARKKIWRLYGYLLTPVFVVVRIGFTAVCLAVGCALTFWDVRFADLFRVSTHAETVWAFVAVIHLTCVLYFVQIDTLLDFSTFYPLSALHLVDLGEKDLWAVYLLKTLNLFEIAYVATVSVGLRNVIRRPLGALVSLVVLSYGGGTILLVSAVTFMMMAFT